MSAAIQLEYLLDYSDQAAVTVQGRKDTTVDLRCGSQNVPIRVGYVPAVNSARFTTGNVRLLDHSQP